MITPRMVFMISQNPAGHYEPKIGYGFDEVDGNKPGAFRPSIQVFLNFLRQCLRMGVASLCVVPTCLAITATLSPSNPIVGVTNVSINGTATAGATVTDVETSPDGTVHSFSVPVNGSGAYTFGPYIIQELGTYTSTITDSKTGASIPFSYTGNGDFSATVNTTSQTVTAGQAASYTVTFTSLSGFSGTVNPATLNWAAVPQATAVWSPQSVTVPSNGSAQATFTIQTAAGTTPGTYTNIIPYGTNGSYKRATPPVSLTVNSAVTLTATLSPSNPIVGVTNVSINGTATAGATVTDVETSPDGTVHSFSVPVNGSGAYTFGPYIIQELGTYTSTITDSKTGASIPFSYTGNGDFSISVNPPTLAITRGSSAVYTVTVSSIGGFAGTVQLFALNWSPQIPGVFGSWSPSSSVSVPSSGSAQATFTIQTSQSTTAGTYTNIVFRGANGSVTHNTPGVSLTVADSAVPTLMNSPSSGPQLTTTFVTQGSGFTPNSAIQRYMTPPGGNLLMLSNVMSDGSGQFAFTYTTSCSDAPGNYQLFAFDPVKAQNSNAITRTITSSSGCAPTGTPTLNSNPSSGDQLTARFPITGGGYAPYATVQLSITPAVHNSTSLGPTTANAGGLIYFVWSTDCSIQPGTYSVTAYDVVKNQSSPALMLTVTSNTSCSTPGPKITQLSPNPMPGSAQPQFLTIFGSGFTPGLKVRLQKQGQPSVDYTQMDLVWADQIRVNVTIDTSAANWTAQVINPDNTSSTAFAFSVSAGAAPLVTSITGKPAVTKGAQYITKSTNLTPNGPVKVLLRLPDGSTEEVVSGPNDVADASGNFTHTLDTSQLGSYGSHQIIHVDGQTGKSGNEIPVTINPPQNGAVTNKNHDVSNDPIDTSTGNYMYDHTDLAVASRAMPFSFRRHYESRDGTPGPMGNGWTHSYFATVASNPLDNSVTIRLGDGYTVVFDLQNGAYKPRYENVYETLTSPSSGTLVLTTKQQIHYTFAMGNLVSISDRNGNTVRLSYTGSNLTAIVDTAGRTYSLAYDPSQRLTTLTDPVGRTLQYAYDASGNLISFTDARGKITSYTYDGASRLLTGVDPENNTFVRNTYDSMGRVSTQTDGQGNTWAYAYAPDSGTTTITDPNQKTSLHIHDTELKLTTEQDSFGNQATFSYDANNNRNLATDRNGHTTRLAFDQTGNAVQVTDALNHVSTATYSAFNDPLTRTDALNNVTTYTYDGSGNLASVRDPLGNTTSYGYNANGQVTSSTDAEGRTTLYTYDAAGNLTQVQDPLGSKTQYTYDGVGRRLTETDALNRTTSYVYDNNDNIIRFSDPLGGVVTYAYDGNNNRVLMTDQRQNTTSYAYDANYKLTTVTDALNGTIKTTYDKLRNPSSVTDQRNGVTKTIYDSESRLIQTIDPTGNSTVYGYDRCGNRIAVTDPLGNTTKYTYDALNRVTAVTDPLNAATKTTYDAVGRVVARTDAANNVTSYTYDAAGRMTRSTDAANGTAIYTYDRVGNRTSVTDPRGKTTAFAYDVLNRLRTITDPLGNVTTNTYDAVGNLAKVTDANGNTRTYAYDGNRRLAGISYSIGSPVSYAYDAAGNRTKMVDGEGTSTFTYDALNRLSSYTHPLGAQLQFTYDAASNRTALQYAPGKVVRYTFNAANRMTAVTDWTNAATGYVYDAAGRVSTTTFPNGVVGLFAYDAANRITSVQYNKSGASLYSEAVAWSANGNPVSANISGLNGNVIPSEASSYTYDDANRLTSTPFGPVSSDRNGNVTVMSGFPAPTVFTYDLNNRATSISGPSITAQMKYFGDGKLAELSTGASSSRYLEDPTATGNRMLAELDSSGNIQRAYIHGLGMVSVLDSSAPYYFAHNLQGSTVLITDGGGLGVAAYRYDPFGHPAQLTGTLTYPFTLLGRYAVPSVGAYAVTGFRLYDSSIGRFTGPDPAHWNLNPAESPFPYADQNPLRRVDPSGLVAVDAARKARKIRLIKARDSYAGALYYEEESIYQNAIGDVLAATSNSLNAVGDLYRGDFRGALTSEMDNVNYLVQNLSQSSVIKKASQTITNVTNAYDTVAGVVENVQGIRALGDSEFVGSIQKWRHTLTDETLKGIDEVQHVGTLLHIPDELQTVKELGTQAEEKAKQAFDSVKGWFQW